MLEGFSQSGVMLPPGIGVLVRKLMATTPPTDEDIESTLATFEAYCRYIRGPMEG